jgi:hypothetical protein
VVQLQAKAGVYRTDRIGAVALSHRAILTPQIFRHDAEDRRRDSHQSGFSPDNRIAFVQIF